MARRNIWKRNPRLSSPRGFKIWYDWSLRSFWNHTEKVNRQNITIVGESNFIAHVEFDVNKNKLILRTSNNKRLHSKTGNPTQIAVTAKELSQMYVIGSGKISSSTSLFSKYLLLELIDSGEIQILVKSQTVSVHITGSGHISLNGSY